MTTPADRLMSATVDHVRRSGALTENCRMGVVSAASSDGTITVTAAGETFPRVRRMKGYVPAVGDLVTLQRGSGGWVCLGAHAATDDGVWKTPTLLGPWSNYGSDFRAARFRRIGESVELEGLVSCSGASGNSDVMVLPAGYRPNAHIVLPAASGGNVNRFNVYMDGTVKAMSLPSGFNSYISLVGRFNLR